MDEWNGDALLDRKRLDQTCTIFQSAISTRLDSFSAHIVDSLKRHFDEKRTNLAVIPKGLTSRLQPLDVAINKSFKSKVRIIVLHYGPTPKSWKSTSQLPNIPIPTSRFPKFPNVQNINLSKILTSQHPNPTQDMKNRYYKKINAN